MTISYKDSLYHFAIFFCLASTSVAAENFDSHNFQTKASFDLTVTKSKYLKQGASRIQSQNAFVSLVHGLMPGNSDGLEIMFLTKPITKASLPDIMNNDAKELRKSSYAAFVLYLDKQNKVWQVNLSYVVPGTTVAHPVAWQPDELKKYFSHVTFDGQRLVLKSRGSYLDIQSEQEALKLDWDVDIDLPVIREIQY